jgi:carbon monoxide dehydrogenase subunit G
MNTGKLVSVLTIGGALLTGQLLPSEALAQAAQQQTQGATVAYTTEAVATVESVDQQTRMVVLRGTGGRVFEVYAGPAVENLARVKQGDRVVVRYVEALAASLARPSQGGGTATEQSGISRHAPGQSSPTGTVGSQMRSTVTIEEIDRATHTVTFSGPGNRAHMVAVQDPEMRRFVETLKVGDRVDLVYTESMAVAVEPLS